MVREGLELRMIIDLTWANIPPDTKVVTVNFFLGISNLCCALSLP